MATSSALYGCRAGEQGPAPTASAVMGDVLRIAKGISPKTSPLSIKGELKESQPTPAQESQRTDAPNVVDMDDLQVRYYLRLTCLDRFGVLAKIASVFGEATISIASVLQFDSDDERGLADLVIMTHPSREANMQDAASRLRQLDVVASLENLIRVEDYDTV